MQPRFVIVPAVPIEGESFRIGNRLYVATTSGGFDIYDNQEKERLRRGFANRSEAAAACDEMNAESRNPEARLP
ncbi:Arm DNA-binding domain-containing protein [Pseudomonas parasichuanensis]|uniref:Arm DNA-binding domain-containing protein n=1 Tax=Pseudomonas parasichuanensis TaxID=2892329 RepID=UPI001F470D9F|nr:Arm DNA-binding domain-containing protein [Pseudomonas parasichuanensis]